MPFGQDEIETVFKKRFVIAAVTDRNFRDLFMEALKDSNRQGYSGCQEETI